MLEEGIENGGFGACVAAKAACQVPGLVINYAGVGMPMALQASRPDLVAQAMLDVPGIEARMRNLLQER